MLLTMGPFERIFGICKTKTPRDAGGWKYSGSKLQIEWGRVPDVCPVGQYVWKGGGFQKKFWSCMVSTDNSMPSEVNVRIAAESLILLMPNRMFGVVVYQDQSLIILVT